VEPSDVLDPSERRLAESVTPGWWLFLITGILNLILGFIVLSYDTGSLLTVSILIGFSFLFTGLSWLVGASGAGEMKWWFIVGGVLALIAAIIAFAYPDETLRVLGLLTGWFLLVVGIIDIIASLANRDRDLWWLGLIQGLVMLVLGVWAAGEDDRSIFLLLTLVGIFLVVRGAGHLITAFGLRRLKRDLAAGKV
jgi:uncharacterized membrane protein HdeD (DUF308 family)